MFSNTDLADLITTLENCTLTGNSASTSGGAIHNNDGQTVLTHCTITDNEAPAGAGSGVASYGDIYTETSVSSCILSGNGQSDVDLVSSNSNNSFVSSGSNLVGSGNAIANFNAGSDLVGGVDPLLADLGNYGGPTPTMPPCPAVRQLMSRALHPHSWISGAFPAQWVRLGTSVRWKRRLPRWRSRGQQ